MHKSFVYFGTPYVSSDTLAVLVEHGYVPALVVTSPDAPSGRGQELKPPKTKEWALQNNLPVITPEKLTPEVVEEIRKTNAQYAVVVAYGQLLPQTLIDTFPLGILNIHYSLLPKYRGASPVESALLNNETATGVAIQKMVKELDAGDLFQVIEVAIGPTETTRELRPRLIQAGAKLLVEALPSFENETAVFTPQDHTQATRCGKIAKEEGLIDLSGDAQTNWNKYRAYAESPGTYFFIERNNVQIRVKIITAEFRNGEFIPVRIVPEGKNEVDYATFMGTGR